MNRPTCAFNARSSPLAGAAGSGGLGGIDGAKAAELAASRLLEEVEADGESGGGKKSKSRKKKERRAKAKLARKGCDWIIANDVTQPGVMGGSENAVILITAGQAEHWPRMDKSEVARRLAEAIAESLGAA